MIALARALTYSEPLPFSSTALAMSGERAEESDAGVRVAALDSVLQKAEELEISLRKWRDKLASSTPSGTGIITHLAD